MKDNIKKINVIFILIQLIASALCWYGLFHLGMLPESFLLLAAVILAAAFAVVVFCLHKGGKLQIAGRIFCVLFSAVLLAGSYYVSKAAGTVEQITTNDGVKLDSVVVAVLDEDEAETLEDAAEAAFGVQYQLKGNEITETVDCINEELGFEILTVEYENMTDQISGLINGEVRALILNEAYIELLEETEDISLKVIYTHDVETKAEVKAGTEAVKTEEEAFIIYVSGIDVYGSIKKTSRSDVNILAVVNPNTHQILLVTTPRDYYVEFPGVTGGAKDKLTHAGIYGVDVSMATLGALYDIQPDFYIRINFTSFEKIIDVLGGVDVSSEYAFTTRDGKYTFSKGINHISGKEALAFCRERYNLADGDFQRGKNQQAVIEAMIEKAASPSILMNAGSLLDSLAENIDTDMSAEQIQKLVKFQLENPQSWEVTSVAAKATGDRQYCYSMPGRTLYVAQPDDESVEEIKEMIQKVENGETLSVPATEEQVENPK